MPRIITKPSAALRAAAKLIEKGTQRHACYALDALYAQGIISSTVRHTCQRYIRKLLGDHGILETWLRANVPECEGLDLWTVRNFRKVKQTRLAWIEWMAQQFEAQGR